MTGTPEQIAAFINQHQPDRLRFQHSPPNTPQISVIAEVVEIEGRDDDA